MEEMTGYCGYNCHLCAARSEDPAVRQKLVDGWRKIFGLQMYTAENVKCGGCRGKSKIADKECQARPCAMERGVDSCAGCDDFVCDKLRNLISNRQSMLVFHQARLKTLTEEEYNLCIRQFDGMPNLLKILVKAEKLPSWVINDPDKQI
ncbi:MAG: hypothetical protein CVT49_15880 [candidate division Zixibacteria bacterium HGW-Zixibacteria-1]|nr:MAG: hypothetical protein CVT49_15880 [candidate division Zixibacteria bacterium HGW-Zixibacteria-1]